MKFQSLLIVTTVAILLSGCATQKLNFSAQDIGVSQRKIDAKMQSIIVTIANHKERTGDLLEAKFLAISIVGVAAGAITSNINKRNMEEEVPQLWQTSLKEALNKMEIFQVNGTKKLNLSVKILMLDVPLGSFTSFTTKSEARYQITDERTGDVIFTQNILASGTTPFGYSFSGAASKQESLNRAVQNNITQFIKVIASVDML